MPRHFSSEERIDIENRLIAAAKELFLQYGINKTTISDITEKARVGKGTFYLFFKSKGDIYLKLYMNEWTAVHDIIDKKYLGKKGKLDELILDYICENRKQLLSHPILSIVYDRHTLSLISDSSVKNRIETFSELGDSRLKKIINSWLECNNINCSLSTEVISGMMRSLSYLNYHKDEIGEEYFEEVIKQFAAGITLVVNQKRID